MNAWPCLLVNTSVNFSVVVRFLRFGTSCQPPLPPPSKELLLRYGSATGVLFVSYLCPPSVLVPVLRLRYFPLTKRTHKKKRPNRTAVDGWTTPGFVYRRGLHPKEYGPRTINKIWDSSKAAEPLNDLSDWVEIVRQRRSLGLITIINCTISQCPSVTPWLQGFHSRVKYLTFRLDKNKSLTAFPLDSTRRRRSTRRSLGRCFVHNQVTSNPVS